MDKIYPSSDFASAVDPVTQMKIFGVWNPENPKGQSGFTPGASATNPYILYPNIKQTSKVIVKAPGPLYFTPIPTPRPITMTCPHCQQNIVTRVRPIKGCATHLAAAGLCLFGCILCFYMPYLLGVFKDKEHSCPKCRGFIGTYKRF